MRNAMKISSLAAAVVFAGTASAASTTTNFGVTATVAASCKLSTVPTLDFGAYDPTTGTNLDASTSITTTCTNTTPYNIGLDAGTSAGATVNSRKMASGSDTLSYNLYMDSSYTQNWGNTVGSDTVSMTGSGSAQSVTVYGRIPASASANPGSYSDSILVTVSY